MPTLWLIDGYGVSGRILNYFSTELLCGQLLEVSITIYSHYGSAGVHPLWLGVQMGVLLLECCGLSEKRIIAMALKATLSETGLSASFEANKKGRRE